MIIIDSCHSSCLGSFGETLQGIGGVGLGDLCNLVPTGGGKNFSARTLAMLDPKTSP